MIPPPIDTPDKLKAAREALGLSLTDMAEALRLAGSLDNARTYVREMEAGKRPISGPIQVAVEAFLLVQDLLDYVVGVSDRGRPGVDSAELVDRARRFLD